MRQFVPADEATHEKVRHGIKQAVEKYGLFGEGFAAAVHDAVEEVLGAYHAEYDGETSVRYVRLDPEPSGAHLCVSLTF
jgi:hypothetical protein